MKTAFVHDRIAHEGGAEAVLRELIRRDTHDEWAIFSYYSKQTRRRVDDKTYRIVTALPRRLNKWFIICNTRKFFLLSTLFEYRNLMFRFPLLTRRLSRKIKKYNPSNIIISSFAAVKNINTHIAPTTLYLHSPMQYIRENYKENIQKVWFPIKQLYMFAAQFLRPRDKKKRTYNKVFFNSEYTQKLWEKMYGLKWEVWYPPVDKAFNGSMITDEIHGYFLFVWRIVKYVREIDKIIRLFNAVKQHIIIVGDGPDMGYAQTIAGPTVVFTGRVDDVEEKKKLLQHARGYINLAKESFGIGTAEALCCGVPVFGYKWWATEYFVDESNGYVVSEKDDKTLNEWFEKFVSMRFDRKNISEKAQRKFFG